MADFLIIGFTPPDDSLSPEHEAGHIAELLGSGAVDLFHIRKPGLPDSYVRSLMEAIPVRLHSRIVLHSNFNLFKQFSFKGLHYKSESSALTSKFVSMSCHSLAELDEFPFLDLEYKFLSPIFDSISKEGYGSAFNIADPHLHDAIDGRNVIALGGVTPEFFGNLFRSKFAGAALLGYLWSPISSTDDKIRKILRCRRNIND